MSTDVTTSPMTKATSNQSARTSSTSSTTSTESEPGQNGEVSRQTVIIAVCSVVGAILVIAVVVIVVKISMARRAGGGVSRLGRFYFSKDLSIYLSDRCQDGIALPKSFRNI